MTEFEATAELDVVVNQSSLRAARQEIEDELEGAATVNATASNQLSAATDGGIADAGGGLVTEQQATNKHLDELTNLAETRTELLRDISQNTGQMDGDGGGLALLGAPLSGLTGGLLGAGTLGAAGLGAAGLGFMSGPATDAQGIGQLFGGPIGTEQLLGQQTGGFLGGAFGLGKAAITGREIREGFFGDATDNPASEFGNELSNLEPPEWLSDGVSPSDLLSPTEIGVGDVISSGPLGAGAFIGSGLPLGVPSLLNQTFPLSVQDIISSVRSAGAESTSTSGPPGPASVAAGASPGVFGGMGSAVNTAFQVGGAVTDFAGQFGDPTQTDGNQTTPAVSLSPIDSGPRQQPGGPDDGGSVTVDATVENVDASGSTSKQDVVDEVTRELQRELERQLPNDISSELQRGFNRRL